MKITQKTYDNGLRLVFAKNNKNVVGLNILFFVGSQNETEKEWGYSHFIEHLVFKGSDKRTAEELSDELTCLGADFNACTSRTTTRFTFKCLSENFEKCFEIYADMLLSSSFRNSDIDNERNVVIEEMKRVQDDPVEVLYAKIMENYFGENSYAHDELGTEQIIQNVTRDELLEYKSRFYVPNRCIISVVGNLDFEKLDEIIQRYFDFGNAFPFVSNSNKVEPQKVDFTKFNINIKNQFDIIKRSDNQANVGIHIKSVTCDNKLKNVAELYTCILGNQQNSRLYKRIREQLGLVYSIYATNMTGARSGELFILFGTRPENVKKAMNEIKNIISELGTNGITESELICAKNLRKSVLEYSFEGNADIADIMATQVLYYGKVKSQKSRSNEIDKVTLEDVNNFAKQIANEKVFNIVAVGKNIKRSDIECHLVQNKI